MGRSGRAKERDPPSRPASAAILAVALVGFTLLAGVLPLSLELTSSPVNQSPIPRSPVQHVVEIMMENHAFDNLFGTFPGALGFPANVSLPNGSGGWVQPYWIPGNSTPDLPHDRASEIADRNGTQMNGFVQEMAKQDPGAAATPMGYYNATQVPGYWTLAHEFVLCDQYFASVLGPTLPNRLYAIAGSSAGITTDTWPAGGISLPTVFDQLSPAGVSWRYYYVPSGFPPIPLQISPLRDTLSEAHNVVPITGLLSNIQAGDLPNVTFVDPEASSVFSEHPPESVTVGEAWSLSIIDAVEASPLWNSTVIFLTWDEGGGFYDSFVPPVMDSLGDGFRVPLLVISPFTRGGGMTSQVFDHTSILKFIDSNWGLPFLNARVAAANTIGMLLGGGVARIPSASPTDPGGIPDSRRTASVALATTAGIVAPTEPALRPRSRGGPLPRARASRERGPTTRRARPSRAPRCRLAILSRRGRPR